MTAVFAAFVVPSPLFSLLRLFREIVALVYLSICHHTIICPQKEQVVRCFVSLSAHFTAS